MGFKKLLWALMMISTLSLTSACSMGRKSISAGMNTGRLSEAYVLNTIYDNGNVYEHFGEFQVQLNLDHNFVYVDVLGMGNGWTPDQTYRILAKRHDGTWWTLAEGLDAMPGETIEIDALQGHKVYEYVEWIIEFEYGDYGMSFGFGDPAARIVQDQTPWEELNTVLQASNRR